MRRLLLSFLLSSMIYPAMAEERKFGGEFCLNSIDGQHCLADFRHKIVLLYFGYTACPDVCPTSLAILGNAYRGLPPQIAKDVVMLMITLDPERDTSEKMSSYVRYFHPNMLGLTGDISEIAQIAKQYGATYQKMPLDQSELGYVVDHSASIYLIDTNGELMGQFKHGISEKEIVSGVIYAYGKR